ncbi:helix-turn-helix transcriptional regulator [Conexibacter sp. JD483]|uniref:helix-turn-helix domain-containing protein n=1 Tax=unclassified Conexibacter TaxID=2627773 RepID=UPI00271E3A24|nr:MULTISPECIES: helix-turn-helix transcriptional regulator [unclassified Conexibacter]MDO8187997.1 helix-turn-helix transcriptional regulator [Conexibacter sp. CPCC 205706]MDO8200880.1 helix-turn-helix transcriptional regulator [Conexibacter sp. CPCC 205762]MDR9370387.1 helix-turn-helix transcriptional regulator [Conexibacter sp. JD483]
MHDASPQLAAFAKTLRKLRRDRELSQDALADLSGVTAKHIGEIERANKDPRVTTVLRLIEGLDMPPAEVFQKVGEQLERLAKVSART